MSLGEGKFTDGNLVSMLQSRMGWNIRTPKCPYRDVRCYELADSVAIILVAENEVYNIDDDKGLFPSDALVTKIRIMDQ